MKLEMSIVVCAISLMSVFCDFFQRSLQKPLLLIFILLLSILMGGSFDIPDEINYINYYEASRYFAGDIDPFAAIWFNYSTDLGYAVTNYIFYDMGFSYYEHRLILVCLFMFILACVVYEFTVLPGVVLFFYLQYPFFFDVPQFRNFLAEIFLLIAIFFLAKRMKIYALLFMFIGALFHKVACIYLVFFPFAIIYGKKWGKKTVYFLVVLGGLLPLYASYVISRIGDLQFFLLGLDGYSQYAYYASREMNSGYLITWGHVILLTIAVAIIRRKLALTNLDLIQYRLAEVLYVFYLFMVCISPLFAVHGDFNRIPRNILLPTYILFSVYLSSICNKQKQLAVFMLMLFIIVVIAYFEFFMVPELSNLPSEIVNNNYIIDVLLL